MRALRTIERIDAFFLKVLKLWQEPINIEKWQAAGGHGILYQANRDPLTKVKKGLEEYGKIFRNQ